MLTEMDFTLNHEFLEVWQWQAGSAALGWVKVQGKWCTVVIDGLFHVSGAQGEEWVALEAPSLSSLPGGLLAPSSPYLWNANLQQVIGKEHSAFSNVPETKEKKFDFVQSPLQPEWKERITKLLNSMPEVFAQYDLDCGHTDKGNSGNSMECHRE